MKQISLKLNSYAGNINIVNNYDIQKRVRNTMFIFVVILAFCYVLILGNTVFNIIERRVLETESRSLSNEIGNLELQYLSMSDKVDFELAKSMGFKEIKAKFATRKTLGYGLSSESIGSVKLTTNEI